MIKRNLFSQDSSAWLVLASASSMILGLVSVPLLSRYFSSSELGLYQEFFSYGMILGPLACLRYETSVVSQEGERFFSESYSASVLVLALLFFLSLPLVSLHFILGLPSWVAIFPLFIFSYGLMILGSSVALREKKLRNLGVSKLCYFSVYMLAPIIHRAISEESSYLWFVWFMIMGQFLFLFLLPLSEKISVKKAIGFISDNFSFVRTLAPLTLLSGVTVQLPVLFLSFHFDYKYLGAYLIASRFLNFPISLVATPVGQYIQSIYTGSSKAALQKVIFLSSLVISVLYILILILSTMDLSEFFGSDWSLVQDIVWFLVFAKIMQGINLPLANILALVKKRYLGLGIVVVFLPIRWLLMGMLGSDWVDFLIGTLSGTALFYFVYSYFSYQAAIAEVKLK